MSYNRKLHGESTLKGNLNALSRFVQNETTQAQVAHPFTAAATHSKRSATFSSRQTWRKKIW